MRALRLLLPAAALFALLVVTVGAYTRLKDAGLGCPDWPGCYGQLVGVPELDAAGTPIDLEKAWIEVAHRYVAGALGLLIFALAVIAWRTPAARRLRWPAAALVALLVFQAGLGALTVTELLQPAIVTAHLLGGLAIFGLLVVLATQALELRTAPPAKLGRPAAAAALALLVMQIALGGWVSTNYAGLACGAQWPACGAPGALEFDASGFAPGRELGRDSAGAPLTQRALMSIQWAHRLGSYLVAAALAALALLLWRDNRIAAATLLALLLLQFGIGVYIVMKALPLAASLFHNTGAALLVAWFAAYLPAAGAAARAAREKT
ncbi:MAG: COX15/CtaA family protein [Betaproteobacteria bacterium AqS2]|uniref:COX15/CtaA family protein n=1 Tax=Candidatus Amphirhobacter heronislandensis TaxID=1732024 RepID=A0A930UGK8_9GAMM|nr:COX15/CtaA family protein [Betaproteobacteria bacterium AqS2]